MEEVVVEDDDEEEVCGRNSFRVPSEEAVTTHIPLMILDQNKVVDLVVMDWGALSEVGLLLFQLLRVKNSRFLLGRDRRSGFWFR